ncbi:MAG: gluconate 2-dehydrogenase subunit 3 family protein [Gillisia sp.]
MNRREVIKNLGLGAGVLIIGPTTLSLLESCQNKPDYDWQPVFLSAGNGFALKQILETMLPKTDTPGATDLNLAQFIDAYMKEVAPKETQDKFKQGANDFASAFKNEFDKDLNEGTEEDYKKMLDKYLVNYTPTKVKDGKKTGETQDPEDKTPKLDINASTNSYLNSVRSLGIWGWKTSEQVGENVLWYDPIPGEYIPCGPVSELGNGKAMSL